MSEWHVTPDYIVNNWTDELLDLMMAKLVERKQREVQAMQSASEGRSSGENMVSEDMFFKEARNLIKVVRK